MYSTSSADDQCTLFADRNLINRRNVSSDTKHAYSPNKQMFLLALKARVVAAGMKVLGLKELNGTPTKEKFPINESKQDQKAQQKYLRKISTTIVDEHNLDNTIANQIISSSLNQEEQERAVDSQRMSNDTKWTFRLSLPRLRQNIQVRLYSNNFVSQFVKWRIIHGGAEIPNLF